MPYAQKVLMLVENRPAPSDARVWPEALALRNHGYDVTVISPKGDRVYRESYCRIDGIHIYRYALPTGDSALAYLIEYSIAFIMTLWLSLKVWRQRGIDIIHTANPPDIFFPIGWLFGIMGKKFIFDQHDLTPELFQVLFIEGRGPGRLGRLLHRLLLLCERCTYRAADVVIVTNQTFRRIATSRGNVSPEKAVVVRNAPQPLRRHTPRPAPELKLGRRYLLVYIGVMGAQDGVDYAVRALDLLVHGRGRQDVALALLGDGAYVPVLRTLAHELGLDEYIHFAGWVGRDDITRYLETADVGLSPDPYNALNDACTMIKTMEYMAMGIPVVAFDLAETRFTAQEAALYATPNLVEEFADNIATLLDDDVLRHRMGAIGHKRIEHELSWKQSSEQLLRAYAQVTGKPAIQHADTVATAQALNNQSQISETPESIIMRPGP